MQNLQQQSFLFLDFRRLHASDSRAGTTTELPEEDTTSGTKRKAQTSQVKTKKLLMNKYSAIDWIIFQIKKPKKLAAPSSKRMRSSDEKITNGDDSITSTKTMTLII